MNRFNVTLDPCNIGFQEHARINLRRPIDDESLRRRRLLLRKNREDGDPLALRKIIEHNSSLRVDFGWSFESEALYKKVMKECVDEVVPLFNEHAGIMTTDLKCSWIGFAPHNVYDREVYRDLSTYGLILFNNDIIDFQTAVVKFIANHHVYRQHAIIRDDSYRYDYFKGRCKDRLALAEGYRFFMDAILEICLIPALPRDLVEQYIGCHFLYQPDLFFELMEFSILKGEVGG